MYTHGPMGVGVRGTASLGNKMLNEEKFGGWSLLEMCGIIHSFHSLHPLNNRVSLISIMGLVLSSFHLAV